MAKACPSSRVPDPFTVHEAGVLVVGGYDDFLVLHALHIRVHYLCHLWFSFRV